jgi:hypothetical protein
MKFRKTGLTLVSILFLGQAALAGNIYTPHSRHKRLGTLDTVTGTFTDVGSFELPESILIPAMAVDIDGALYGLANRKGSSGLSQLVMIDQATAQVTPVGFPNAINLMAFDIGPDGTAYVAGFNAPAGGWLGDSNLYRIDKATGELTLIGETGVDKLMDFAFDSSGTMWGTVANELYVIDTSTGAAQHTVTITGLDAVMIDPAAEVMGIMFDENDVLYATAISLSAEYILVENSPLFIIDTVTGQATVVAQPEISIPHGGAYEATVAEQTAGKIYTPHSRHKHLGVLDTVTGTFTDVGSFGLPESILIPAMAFGIDGTLYGLANRKGSETTSGLSQLVVIDRATAQVTPVGFPNAINLMAFDTGPDGTTYVGGFNKPAGGWIGDTNLYRIDTTTGELTLIGDTGVNKLMDFTFDSSGTMWGTVANELYVIDTGTGAAQHAVTITGLDAVMIDPAAEVMGIMFDENDVIYATALSFSPEYILVENAPVFIIDTVTGQATVVARPELSIAHGGDIFVDTR